MGRAIQASMVGWDMEVKRLVLIIIIDNSGSIGSFFGCAVVVAREYDRHIGRHCSHYFPFHHQI